MKPSCTCAFGYFGAYVRRNAFWVVDALRRPSVRRQIQDLSQQLLEGPVASAVRVVRLGRLLSHAVRTTRHYEQFSGCGSLTQFPVLRKQDICADRSAFESTAYARQQLPIMATSGSTGIPMQFRLTPLKRCRQRAEIIYFSDLVGFKLGMRHANVRVIRNKSALRCWIENQVLLDPSVVNEAWLVRARSLIVDRRMICLTGYARPIALLARYCLDRGDQPDRFSLKAVVPTAEVLSPEERRCIETVFGCPVINRYGSQEFGVLAQECTHGQLHLNTASYIIELLSMTRDTPARPGELGRVVITDLFSYAMPLIRYDIGDLAVAAPGACSCGNPTPTISQLRGRLLEMILDTQGQFVSPFVLVNSLREISGLTQFRFLQRTSDEYVLEVVVNSGFRDGGRLATLLRKYLGERASIEISRMDELPPLQSGKRPYVVNEYLKQLPCTEMQSIRDS